MAIEDIFEGNLGTGLAVGLGVAVLGPLVGPIVGNVLRPAAKMLIKGGIYVYDQAREAVAQVNDAAGDMVAEVRADMAEPTTARRPGKGHGSEAHPTPAG